MSDPTRRARDDYPVKCAVSYGGGGYSEVQLDRHAYEAMLDEIDTLRRHADEVVATWITLVNLAGGPWTNDRTYEWQTARIDHQNALERLRSFRAADYGTETPK